MIDIRHRKLLLRSGPLRISTNFSGRSKVVRRDVSHSSRYCGVPQTRLLPIIAVECSWYHPETPRRTYSWKKETGLMGVLEHQVNGAGRSEARRQSSPVEVKSSTPQGPRRPPPVHKPSFAEAPQDRCGTTKPNERYEMSAYRRRRSHPPKLRSTWTRLAELGAE